MSQVVVPNIGKKNVLKHIVGIVGGGLTTLRLFRNDITPGPGTVIGDFTEANFSGYANGALANAAVAAALDGSNRAVASWDQITFTKNGATGNTIYGYYVTDGGGDLCFAERFDGPIPMTVDGAFIQLTPKFTFKSEFVNS